MKKLLILLVLAMALTLGPAVAQPTAAEEKAMDTNDGVPLAAPEDTEMYNGTNVGGPP